MANFETIIFNGIPLPNFIKVVKVKHSVLPQVSQTLLTIGGRAGAYDFGNVIGTREIEIDIKIIMSEINTLPNYLGELSKWLYTENAEKLVLGDNVDRYYMAKVSGDTDITEEIIVGSGTIKFVCTDPYIYGNEFQALIPNPYNGNPILINNNGNSKTYPEMEFTITTSLTKFSVVSEDEVIDFGSPFSVDNTPEDIVDAGGYVATNYLKSLNGWSVPPSVPWGTIQGSFEVYSGSSFRQASLDYGTGSSWRGAALTRPLTQSATDFEGIYYFRMDDSNESMANAETQLGKMEFALTDSSLSPVVTMVIHDSWKDYNSLHVKLDVYNGSNSHTILNESVPQRYRNFEGFFIVKRIKNVWTAILCYDSGRIYEQLFSKSWTDGQKIYTKKVANVQISTMAFSTFPSVYMEFRDIKVITHDVVEDNTKIPIILRSGDVLKINNETGSITKNGRPFYKYLNPYSTFVGLEPGANGIVVTPKDGFKDGKIIFKEKSL